MIEAQTPAPSSKRLLVDIGLAFLMVYVAVLAITLTYELAFLSIPQSMFLFFLFLLFPFVAIPHDPIGLIYIAFFIALFVLILRYVPSRYRKFALAAALGGWEYYGLYCLILVTGGA